MMKRLVLLLALLSSCVHAETILMTCELSNGATTYRYHEGLFGLGETRVEVREAGSWQPFCVPSERFKPWDDNVRARERVLCVLGDKSMSRNVEWAIGAQPGAVTSSVTVDFFMLQYQSRGLKPDTIDCSRLNRG